MAASLAFAGAAVAATAPTAAPLEDGAHVQDAKMPDFLTHMFTAKDGTVAAPAAPAKTAKTAKAETKAKPAAADKPAQIDPAKLAARVDLTVLPRRKPSQVAKLAQLAKKAAPVAKPPVLKPASLKPAADADMVIALVEGQPKPAVAEDVAIRLPAQPVMKPPSLIDRVLGLGPNSRLSDDDAARYAHIFAFQDSGDFAKANDEIGKLTDDRLMGHVLAQRYESPQYKATYEELAAWMKTYADLPGAQKISDLAHKRQPKHAPALPQPRAGRGVYALYDFDVGQLATPYMGEGRHTPRQRDVMHAVNEALSDSSPTTALKRLDKNQKLFDDTQYDAMRADIAASYFYNGKQDKAREIATSSASRSGRDVPLAAWIAGLASWRQHDYPAAAKYFETTANSNRTSAWMAAASAHWAARAFLRNHQPQKVSYWLHRSAEYPRTFYGIISMKILGMEQARFNWDVPDLTSKHVKALSAVPAGRRALALVDAERPDLAEAELKQMNPGDDAVLQEAMLALANRYGMPGLSLRMGSSFKGHNGQLFDAALYPDAPWEPGRGFSVDKALVYAFIRQESQFVPQANNHSSGAIGLMQLMPDTAKHVAHLYGQDVVTDKLQDPMVNIDLGQKYLAELLKNEYVENNLFKLAVAYNAGPGKLARWEETAHEADDPLLFIESIPVAETRIFTERVLTNYWIYRIKFHQDTDSLDKVAEGSWPVYMAQDDSRRGARFASADGLIK